MCLTIFKFKPNSSQLGALEGKDMISEHFAFSSNVFRSLKKTMQWQLSYPTANVWNWNSSFPILLTETYPLKITFKCKDSFRKFR